MDKRLLKKLEEYKEERAFFLEQVKNVKRVGDIEELSGIAEDERLMEKENDPVFCFSAVDIGYIKMDCKFAAYEERTKMKVWLGTANKYLLRFNSRKGDTLEGDIATEEDGMFTFIYNLAGNQLEIKKEV